MCMATSVIARVLVCGLLNEIFVVFIFADGAWTKIAKLNPLRKFHRIVYILYIYNMRARKLCVLLQIFYV